MVDFLRTTLLLLLAMPAFAGPSDDNHVHVEQVGSGDDLSLNIEQIGYDNFIDFSFAHSGNTFNFRNRTEMETQSHGYHIGVLVNHGVVMLMVLIILKM